MPLTSLQERALEQLKSPEVEVRDDAVLFLSDGKVVPILIEVIKDTRNSDSHRASAIVAAESAINDFIFISGETIVTNAAIEAFVFATQRDQPSRVRRAAVDALGGIGFNYPLDDVAIERLRQIVAQPDEDTRLRRAGAAALAAGNRRLPSSVIETLIAVMEGIASLELRITVVGALDEYDSQSVAAALASVASNGAQEAELREAAIDSLSEVGAAFVLPQLRRLLRDDLQDIRRAAANAIGGAATKGQPAREDLRLIASDQRASPELRLAAVAALSEIGGKEQLACSALLAIVTGVGETRLRAASAEVLPRLCPDKTTAVRPLAGIIINADEPIVLRLEAADALARIGREASAAVKELRTVAKTSALNDPLTVAATRALGWIGPASNSATDELRNFLQNVAAGPDLRLDPE